jgi:inosine triphosphate pyrophosphatase
LPELQGDPDDVALEKCRLAAERVGGAVMTEDTSLGFAALGGLPGVYIKWFLDRLGHEGLNRLLVGWDDKGATAQCIFAFSAGPGAPPRLFHGAVPGRIVPARGPKAFGWDPIFQPDGHELTFAEMDKDVKNAMSHRSLALRALQDFLVASATEVAADIAGRGAAARSVAAAEEPARGAGARETRA